MKLHEVLKREWHHRAGNVKMNVIAIKSLSQQNLHLCQIILAKISQLILNQIIGYSYKINSMEWLRQRRTSYLSILIELFLVPFSDILNNCLTIPRTLLKDLQSAAKLFEQL